MPNEDDVNDVNRLVDELYGGGDTVPRETIVERARSIDLAPDVQTYFDRLPPGEYSRKQLVETLNREIRERGRAEEVGQFKP